MTKINKQKIIRISNFHFSIPAACFSSVWFRRPVLFHRLMCRPGSWSTTWRGVWVCRAKRRCEKTWTEKLKSTENVANRCDTFTFYSTHSGNTVARYAQLRIVLKCLSIFFSSALLSYTFAGRLRWLINNLNIRCCDTEGAYLKPRSFQIWDRRETFLIFMRKYLKKFLREDITTLLVIGKTTTR